MQHFLIALGFALTASAHAGSNTLPSEVAAFIQDRDTCDHFRDEPHEGNSSLKVSKSFAQVPIVVFRR
jgi:hypothetical protein